MIKPGSQNARILEALADGEWHTTAAIHSAAGFSRLNSRVAELRDVHGYDIPCRPIEGMPPGPHAQRYRLVATPSAESPQREPSPLDTFGADGANDVSLSALGAAATAELREATAEHAAPDTYEQLTLVAA